MLASALGAAAATHPPSLTMTAAADLAALSSTELPPPQEPKRKDKKWRPHPRKGALTRRGPPRPYRRVPEEVLHTRIQKLTTRMERAKGQHESARALLTKYSHEKTYRLREALAAQEEQPPMPEFPSIQSTIPDAPQH